MAAALATLELLDGAAYRRLADVTDALADGLRRVAAGVGVPLQVQTVPGLVTPFFAASRPRLRRRGRLRPRRLRGLVPGAARARRVPPASQFEAWFPSLAHTDDDLERTIDVAAHRAGADPVSADMLSRHSAPRAGRSPSTSVSRTDGGAAGAAANAAAGPRAAGHEAEYELLLEMILEGSRLHYGAPRVVHADDHDLALLLGDELYALGLARLAALGDLKAVARWPT